MKRKQVRGFPTTFIGAIAGILLAPQAAYSLGLIFVFDGVLGTFRSLEAGVTTNFPPGEVEINFGPAKGFYIKAPRCILPDCGYVSVTAKGSIFTAPAFFHGQNNGWQLLITSPPPTPTSWTVFGSLLYCPGYEVDGDPEKCPAPGPGTESRAGWLTPPPHPDPGEDSGPAVPGPLPWLGVAAAFGLSRKLRRRINGPLSGSSRTATAPPDPRRAAG